MGHERFVTLTVEVGACAKVTVLTVPIGQEPENLAARTCFGERPSEIRSNDRGAAAGGVSSAERTTFATRSADSRVNWTGSRGRFFAMRHTVGGTPKRDEKSASSFTRRSRMAGKELDCPPLPSSATGLGDATHSPF